MDTGTQTQQMKTCTKCGVTKPSSEFGKRKAAKDGLRAWCKECYACHKCERYQSDTAFREHVCSHKRIYNRGLRQSDPDYRKYFRTYTRERYRSDPDFRTSLQMRHMVQRVLRAADGKKTASSQNLLGYSAKELRAHLESQFEPGMSWDDRGAWHIDHVKPVSAFIAEGIKDPQIINALSNLKPLWAKDNLAKGARY